MKKSFKIIPHQKISINDLILFSVYLVTETREKCTFERLTKECFKSFPQIFCLSQYPQWPDSRKLDRPLRTLRNRKLITGDPQTYFSLTKLGRETAEDIARIFRQRKLFK